MIVTEDRQNGRIQAVDWMEVFHTITTFILFNMLWLFGALFIITIPAVTAALFASIAPWTRGQAPYQPLLTFGKALRRYAFKATVVVLLDLVAAGFIIINLLILWQMGAGHIMGILALAITILIATLIIVSNVYLWPLLVTLDLPLGDLLKNGIKLAIIHPFWGLLVALTAVIPLILSLFLPGFFLLTVTFATPALIIQWGSWRVIWRYLDDNDIQNLGV